jgi:hypothetical protein
MEDNRQKGREYRKKTGLEHDSQTKGVETHVVPASALTEYGDDTRKSNERRCDLSADEEEL